VLVDLERAVHIPIHLGADCGQPDALVGRPKLAKTLPKALPTDSVAALLATLNTDPQPRRRSDWLERDRALILTALLAGLRADELLRANVGDLRRSNDGARPNRNRHADVRWAGPLAGVGSIHYKNWSMRRITLAP
jgi:integrase